MSVAIVPLCTGNKSIVQYSVGALTGLFTSLGVALPPTGALPHCGHTHGAGTDLGRCSREEDMQSHGPLRESR